MSAPDLQAIEQRIVAACDAMAAKGVTIGTGGFNLALDDAGRYIAHGCWVCPLGALLVYEGVECEAVAEDEWPSAENEARFDAARALGVSAEWIGSFTNGVDREVESFDDIEIRALGRRIAERYEPTEDEA